MRTNALPSLDGPLRLSVDVREKNVELPRLAELEHALEPRHRAGKPGTPKRSMFRLEVLRAIKSCGEVCFATVAELASLARCSVRECQYAIQDLLWLGWVEKVADVSDEGGRGGRGARRTGNFYRVTRPSWAWDGNHRKRLWTLAQASGVGVHSMHPLLQEALGLLEGQEAGPAKAIAGVAPRRGAQHAPLVGVHRPKSLSLLLIKKDQKEKSPAPKTTKTSSTARVEWPKDGNGFLQAWVKVGGYARGPFPNKQALGVYQEIRVGAGGPTMAQRVAEAFVADRAPGLVAVAHNLNTLQKQWPGILKKLHQPGPAPKKAVKAAGGDLLDRLNSK